MSENTINAEVEARQAASYTHYKVSHRLNVIYDTESHTKGHDTRPDIVRWVTSHVCFHYHTIWHRM